MKIRWLGGPGEPDENEWNGVIFPKGEFVEVEDPYFARKAAGNPFYEIGAKPEEPPVGLRAVHIARGVFAIMDGATEVSRGLSKADAKAFNALSDDDKAEYIKVA